MMGTRARLGIGAAAASALLAAVAGCSGGGAGADPQVSGSPTDGSTFVASPAAVAAVTAIMRKATASGTVKIEGSVTSAATGRMTITGQERYGADPEMSMSMLIQGQTLSEVIVGSKFYMNYPALSAEMGGKRWGEIDLAKDSSALGSLSSLADTMQQFNPVTQLAALLAAGDMADIGGVPDQNQTAEHFHGQLILDVLTWNDSAAKSLVGSAQVDSIENEFKTSGISREDVDLFCGPDKLPLEISYSTQTAEGGEIGDMVLTGWGAPVNIGAPPASQVFDLAAQVPAAQSSATASPTP